MRLAAEVIHPRLGQDGRDHERVGYVDDVLAGLDGRHGLRGDADVDAAGAGRTSEEEKY